MSGCINEVVICGHLGRDPEVRQTQEGKRIANLSVATSETWKDRNSGERKERTEWHRVVIFNEGLAGIAEQYLAKGSKVYLRGTLRTRKWTDQAGVEKYSTEVVLNNFDAKLVLMDKRGEGGGVPPANPDDFGPAPGGSGTGGGSAGGGGGADLDDDIPF